jgi:hypothetical protein
MNKTAATPQEVNPTLLLLTPTIEKYYRQSRDRTAYICWLSKLWRKDVNKTATPPQEVKVNQPPPPPPLPRYTHRDTIYCGNSLLFANVYGYVFTRTDTTL